MSDNQNPEAEAIDYGFLGMIDDVPGVSHQLGLIVANFAVLEVLQVIITAAAIGESQAETKMAHIICGNTRGFADRCKIVRDLVEASPHLEDAREGIVAIIEEMRQINTVRNSYVHAIWEGQSGKAAWLTPYAISAHRAKGRRPVTPDEMADLVLQIRRLSGRTFHLLKLEITPM